MNLSVNVTLTETRCWRCRRWYSYETGSAQRCPHCADTVVEDKCREIKRLKNSIRSLRCALTKARRSKQ